jgi:hypothetical protein
MHDFFLVMPSSCGWDLLWNGRVLEKFQERSQAVQAAVVAARMSQRRGRTVEMKSIDRDGTTQRTKSLEDFAQSFIL